MVQGIGWLMDLCPAPESWSLGDMLEPFGLLPSQVASSEDWRFLVEYAAKKRLVSWWDMWHRMVANPDAGISMPTDVIQYMLGLIKDAKEEWS